MRHPQCCHLHQGPDCKLVAHTALPHGHAHRKHGHPPNRRAPVCTHKLLLATRGRTGVQEKGRTSLLCRSKYRWRGWTTDCMLPMNMPDQARPHSVGRPPRHLSDPRHPGKSSARPEAEPAVHRSSGRPKESFLYMYIRMALLPKHNDASVHILQPEQTQEICILTLLTRLPAGSDMCSMSRATDR